MQSSDFGEFKTAISDLCTAYNIPFTDDRVRVMWDGLRTQSLRGIKRRIELHQATAKKFPTIADLMPAKSDRPQQVVNKTEKTVQERLADFVLREYGLAEEQGAMPWKWMGKWTEPVDGRTRGFEFTGVIIPACRRGPSYRVTIEDMRMSRAV